jgi:hypothetical protein
VVAVLAMSFLGMTMPAGATTTPTLAVTIVGPGTVTSTPAAIACPGKCSATFAEGTSVVLTAKPKDGSTFRALEQCLPRDRYVHRQGVRFDGCCGTVHDRADHGPATDH